MGSTTAPDGLVESITKGLTYPEKLDRNEYVVCSSILLRAQQTAFNMFLRGTNNKLFILPNCGEERKMQNVIISHELQADNCPDSEFWENLLQGRSDEDALVTRIGPDSGVVEQWLQGLGLSDDALVLLSLLMKQAGRGIESGDKNSIHDFATCVGNPLVKPDIKYILEIPDGIDEGTWLEKNTKVMNQPDKQNFALTINKLFTEMGDNIRPIIVTHSHFIMEILGLNHDQKPYNNDIFKFVRAEQHDRRRARGGVDRPIYRVERIDGANSIIHEQFWRKHTELYEELVRGDTDTARKEEIYEELREIKEELGIDIEENAPAVDASSPVTNEPGAGQQ